MMPSNYANWWVPGPGPLEQAKADWGSTLLSRCVSWGPKFKSLLIYKLLIAVLCKETNVLSCILLKQYLYTITLES